MTSATLDVNTLISAVITSGGVPHRILQELATGQFRHITSEHVVLTTLTKLREPRLMQRYRLTPGQMMV